jgi:hypothetical protein
MILTGAHRAAAVTGAPTRSQLARLFLANTAASAPKALRRGQTVRTMAFFSNLFGGGNKSGEERGTVGSVSGLLFQNSSVLALLLPEPADPPGLLTSTGTNLRPYLCLSECRERMTKC